MYSCHLFLISSFSDRSLSFLSFIMPILHEMYPWCSTFLEEISSLSHSIVFLSFFAHLRRPSYLSLLISGILEFSSVYLSLSPLPFASLFSSAISKPPQTTTLPSYISFSLRWFWSLPPAQCYESLSIILQALHQI